MRLVGLGLAVAIGAGPAWAQGIPRPVMPIGPLPAQDVSEIVQAMGLDPLGAPIRSGPFYVQRAVDDFGRVLRVTVDARRSQVVAVEAAGAGRASNGAYEGRPYRPYPGYTALGPGDDLGRGQVLCVLQALAEKSLRVNRAAFAGRDRRMRALPPVAPVPLGEQGRHVGQQADCRQEKRPG